MSVLSLSYLNTNIITLITHTIVGRGAPLFYAVAETTGKSFAAIGSLKCRGFGCLSGCLKALAAFAVNAGIG